MGKAYVMNVAEKIGQRLLEGMVFKYEAILRPGGKHFIHQWSIKTEKGGIHVSANYSPDNAFGDTWFGGIDVHLPHPFGYSFEDKEKPNHEHCWLLGGPCWHDGSSLYFSENIAPILPHNGEIGDAEHEYVIQDLLSWYSSHIKKAESQS